MRSIITTITVITFCLQIQAQPGTPDYSFGDSGKVVATTYEGGIYTSVLQPDGKIVAGGSGGYYKQGIAIGGALFARYNANGSLDYTFGDSGMAVADIGGKPAESTYSIALQKDGKIVAAVRGFNTMALIRINSDGSTDKSFGEGGLALGPVDGVYNATDMAILPDGRTVITGTYQSDREQISLPFITSFTPGGSLDKNFGKGGTVITELNTPVIISSIAITSEGKIIIGGRYFVFDETILLAFNKDGKPDITFGKNGIAEMPFEKNIKTPTITDLAIESDGKIVAAGKAYPDNKVYSVFMVSRFSKNGTPDSSFGSYGYTLSKYGIANRDSYFQSVAVQNDGKIIAAGSVSLVPGSADFATVRYDGDGLADSSFGTNGMATTGFSSYGLQYPLAYSILKQSDNKIVVSGYGATKDFKYVPALTRYNGDNLSPRQQIITRIRRWLQHHGITWQTDNSVRYYTVQRSTDGGITYRQLQKIYNNRQATLTYEDNAVTDSGTELYRVISQNKDGAHSISNSISISSEAQVMVYPNPAKSYVTVQGLKSDETANISIKDGSGNVLARGVSTGSAQYRSSLGSNMQPGTYYLNITTGSKTEVLKFVKQ